MLRSYLWPLGDMQTLTHTDLVIIISYDLKIQLMITSDQLYAIIILWPLPEVL